MKLNRLVKKHSKAFARAQQKVDNRRSQWPLFLDRARKVFGEAIDLHEESNQFYDILYIDDNTEEKHVTKFNHGYIALKFGKHAIGIATEQNIDGRIKSFSNEIEKGGALFFGLGADGKVLCMIYECKSDVKKGKDGEAFYFRLFHSPKILSERKLIRTIDFFLWYTRLTSSMCTFNKREYIKYRYYYLRSNITHTDKSYILSLVAKSIGIVVGVVGLIMLIIA